MTNGIFSIENISDDLSQDIIAKNIWQENEEVKIERLKLVNLSYIDFEGNLQNNGRMVVLDIIAPYVINIFKQLLQIKFPINKILLINDFNGDDYLSMEYNNSSAFNYRKIEDTDDLSIHSYGCAIDINPLQNPFAFFDDNKNITKIFPKNSEKYLDRNILVKGAVTEQVIKIFYENGFYIWGGNWQNPIDLHHFQTTRLVARLLCLMDKDIADDFFNICTQNPQKISSLSYQEYDKLANQYNNNPEEFITSFTKKYL